LKKICKRIETPRQELLVVRGVIAGILSIAAIITIFVSSSTINDLGFLSMGLRGSVVFLPLLCALWFPGKVDKRGVFASMILSPCSIFAAKLAALPIDSLFVGIGVSALCCLAGTLLKRSSPTPQ